MGGQAAGQGNAKSPVRAEPHPTWSFALPAPDPFNRARYRSLIVAGQKRVGLEDPLGYSSIASQRG
jgi:hypothetical protein